MKKLTHAITILTFFAMAPFSIRVQGEEVRGSLQAKLRGGSGHALQVDPTCSDGVVYDDGTFETGYGYEPDVETAEFVMRFVAGRPATLGEVCVCFTRQEGPDRDLGFGIVVYDDDGPGGSPGTSLDASDAFIAEDVPVFPEVGIYKIPALNLPTDGRIHVGALWLPELDDGFFICADETGGPVQPAYTAIDLGAWDRLEEISSFADYAALGVRSELLTQTDECTPDATTLCLNDDRYRVTVNWRTPAGDSGSGQASRLTSDTGYFWFFNRDNVEVVVKVLDACGFNNRFWVFAGGLTNVQVDLTIEDTETGTIETYFNPQSTPFEPIQDTNAFATCP